VLSFKFHQNWTRNSGVIKDLVKIKMGAAAAILDVAQNAAFTIFQQSMLQ